MIAKKGLVSLRKGFCSGVFIMFFLSLVAARPLNSIQLASGEWDVSIQGGLWMDPSRIFPSVSQRSICETIPLVKRRPWGTTLDCILSLAPDGTFVFGPKKIMKYTSSRNEEEEISMNDDMSTIGKESKGMGVMYLRGCWNVLANPYCLTDRRYDQVSLTSYSRQRIIPATIDNTEEHVLQTIQMTMNCRLWGRHGRKRREIKGRPTCCGKMTHGTLVWREHGVPWWKYFYRPVLGSFSAVRSSKEPKHEGWLDKEYFGYWSYNFVFKTKSHIEGTSIIKHDLFYMFLHYRDSEEYQSTMVTRFLSIPLSFNNFAQVPQHNRTILGLINKYTNL